eukprot:403341060
MSTLEYESKQTSPRNPMKFSLPKLPDLSPLPISYEINHPLTSRTKKPVIRLKKQSSYTNLTTSMPNMLQKSKNDLRNSSILYKSNNILNKNINELHQSHSTLDLDNTRMRAKASKLALNKQYANIYKNMYTEDNGDLVKAFESIRQKIKASNKMLVRNANSLIMGNSARDILSQNSQSMVFSQQQQYSDKIKVETEGTMFPSIQDSVIEVQNSNSIQNHHDQKSLDEHLDRLFITQNQTGNILNQTHDKNFSQSQTLLLSKQNSRSATNMKQLPSEQEQHFCQFCSHCLLQKGQGERLKKVLKQSLTRDDDFLFMESENFIERIESSSRLMQGLFGSGNLGRKDLILLESLVLDMIDGKISAESIVDKELIQRVKENWLYRGLSCTKNTEHTLNQLQADDLGEGWLQGKIQPWMEDQEIDKKLNESYKKYYLKYHGHTLKAQKQNRSLMMHLQTKKRSKSQDKEQPDSENKNTSTLEEFFQLKFKYLKVEQEEKKKHKNQIDEFDRRAALCFIGIQEVLKETSSKCKERGFLLLKLIKKFLLINEESWIKRIKVFKDMIQRLEHDRDFLLAKATKQVQNIDLKKIVKNDSITAENLAEHKRLIAQMIGQLHKVEDEQYFQELKLKFAETDIKDWLYEWDKIKIYENLKQSVQNIDPTPIVQKHALSSQNDGMSKQEMYLLVNAERFIQAIGYKTKWEIELERIQDQLVRMKNEQFEIEKEAQSYKDAFRHMELVTTTKEQEIMNLNYLNIKLQRELSLRQTANKEVMTEVDMKNLDFISKAEQVFKSKTSDIRDFLKSLQKVKFNQSKQEPMQLKEIVDLVQLVFTKKQQQMSQTKFGEGVEISFEEFLHQVMTQRFGFKKKIKQKTEQFLLGINIHAKNDERFDLIAKILGLDDSEQRYPKEILNTFIKIMNSTDENFMSLLSEEADTTMIETKKALKCSQDIFQNANNFLISSLVKEIFFESEIIIDNNAKMDANLQQKIEVNVLLQFWQAITHNFSQSIIQALQERAESLENGLLDMVILRDLFWSMTREQDRNLMFGYENRVSTDLEQMDDFRNFVQKYFVKELQIVGQCEYLPTKRLKQFLKHKYEIKISVRQYMKKGLNFTLQMLDYCKFFLKKMYQTFDINQNGLMDLNEFENLIKKMMPEKPRWQVNAMFQAITNSIDYERKEISFEQFVNCAMINPLMKGILENTDIDSEILRKRLGHLKK